MRDHLAQLKELLLENCKIRTVQPAIFASDAEISIVSVTLVCPNGSTHVIRAYRDEAQTIREFIRTKT